jgi:large subunit ribosomal protein L30
MANSFLVVRISGQADVPYWARTTLRLLKLEKKYRATIIPSMDNTLGMLKKIQHYVSWQEADVDITKELLEKKGRKSGYKKIGPEDIKASGFSSVNELASSLVDGKTTLKKLKPFKPWFALAPPRHGFKRSTKKLYGQKGMLGHNKELSAMIKNMI